MIMSSPFGNKKKIKGKVYDIYFMSILSGKERRVVKSTCDDLLIKFKKSTKSYNGSFSFEVYISMKI